MSAWPRPSQHRGTDEGISRAASSAAASPNNNGEKHNGRRHPVPISSAKGKNRSAVMSRLQALRRKLTVDLAATEQGLRGTGSVLSEGDQPGYRSSETPNLSTLHHLSMAVVEVDAALEQANNGSYGVCTGCGETIPNARLMANPVAIRCAACQEELERSRK